jgi:hypothetical protein
MTVRSEERDVIIEERLIELIYARERFMLDR